MASLKKSNKEVLINQNLPPEILQTIPKRYLRSKALFNSRNKPELFASTSNNQYYSELLLSKKHFGKKITFIRTTSKLLTSLSCYRYFKTIIFNQISQGYRECSYQLEILSKVGLVVLEKEVSVDNRSSQAILLRVKALTHFKGYYDTKILKKIPRKIQPFINSFSIFLMGYELLQEFQEKLWTFLFSLKYLNKLNLKVILNKYQDQRKFRNIIKRVNQLNFPQYYISISCPITFFIEENLNLLLREIDFLGLTYLQNAFYQQRSEPKIAGYEYFEFYEINDKDFLSQKEHLIKDKKKVLDFYIKSEYGEEKIDLFSLLRNCKSLKGLYIKSLGDPFILSHDHNQTKLFQIGGGMSKFFYLLHQGYLDRDSDFYHSAYSKLVKADAIKFKNCVEYEDENENEYEHEHDNQGLQQNSWGKNLTDLALNINFIHEEQEKKFDYLLSIMKKECPNIKVLDLFCCETFHYFNAEEEYRDEDRESNILLKIKGLTKFTQIQDLTISMDNILQDMFELRQLLPQLKNLRKLCLNFRGRTVNYSTQRVLFPFDLIGNLKELKITSTRDFRNEKWREELITNFPNLKNLEVLEIHGCQEPIMSLEIFAAFIQNLPFLTKIRSLSIVTMIKINSEETGTIKVIKRLIQTYINSNKNLRKFLLGKFSGFGFDWIDF